MKKRIVTLLSSIAFCLSIFGLSACNGLDFANQSSGNHNPSNVVDVSGVDSSVVDESTDTSEDGSDSANESISNSTSESVSDEPSESVCRHVWGSSTVVTVPTCEGKGCLAVTCTVCAETKYTDIPELGHDIKLIETTPKDCEQDYYTSECKICGEQFGYQPARGHQWSIASTEDFGREPTCTEPGMSARETCTVCGATKGGEEIPALGHMEEVIPAVAPTCTKVGWTEGRQCSVCGKVTVAQEEVAVVEHNYDEGVITTEPTCTMEGEKTYTCTECGATKTEAVSVTEEHTWNNGEITKQPTCKTEGEKKYTCTECGATKTEAVSVTEEHTWNNGEITTQPTCKTEGEKTYTCTECGATKTEAVSVTEEHTWNNGETTKQPTCKTEGVKTYTCTECGATKTERIPATGIHSYEQLQDGKKYCKYGCGEYINVEEEVQLEYVFSNNTYTCKGLKDATAKPRKIVILDTYQGYPVTKIETGAFENCTSLVSLTIGKNVKIIGTGAFKNCPSLVEVYNLAGLPNLMIVNGLFTGITIVDGLTEGTASKLEFRADDSVVYKDGGSVELISAPRNATEWAVGQDVTSIRVSAFAASEKLNRLTIDGLVTELKGNVFAGAKIKELIIGENVKRIEAYAFLNCNSITSMTFKQPNGWKADGVSVSLSDSTSAASEVKSITDVGQELIRS